MPDPLGAEHADRVPHGLRAGRLPGVRDAVQAGGAGLVEHVLELRTVDAHLGAAEAEADQRLGRVVEREAQRVDG